MSTQNRWVKKSEREPTPEDLPVWLGASNRKGVCLVYNTICSEYISEHTTHWCSAAADIPAPPREKTQAEKDVAEFNRIHGESVEMTPVPRDLKENHAGRRIGWFSALAYERAEVGKMLPPVRPLVSYGTGITAATDSVEAIRARCGGGK